MLEFTIKAIWAYGFHHAKNHESNLFVIVVFWFSVSSESSSVMCGFQGFGSPSVYTVARNTALGSFSFLWSWWCHLFDSWFWSFESFLFKPYLNIDQIYWSLKRMNLFFLIDFHLFFYSLSLYFSITSLWNFFPCCFLWILLPLVFLVFFKAEGNVID